MELKKGQKADVTKGRLLTALEVKVGWKTANQNIEIDGAAFLLSASGKCDRDEDFIFYGQPESRQKAIIHKKIDHSQRDGFKISLIEIPADIERIAFTLTIHEGETKGFYFSQVSDMFLTIADAETRAHILRFDFGDDLQKETAIVVGELYRYNGEWKFNSIGSGFYGGLAALCGSFGIEVEGEQPVNNEKQVQQLHPVSSINKTELSIKTPIENQSVATIQAPTLLKKVELKKKESVTIKKSSKVTTVLAWENKHKDLDLYCFYVTKNNTTGKVYYKNLGSTAGYPYITLDGDSKNAGSETIVVHRPEELKYVLFAAYSAISNGFGSFKGMKARAVVDNHEGQTVIAPLLQRNIFSYWVAIAHIDFTSPQGMKVSHVESYSKGGSEKSPLLYEDGSFNMDVGPIEFKKWR